VFLHLTYGVREITLNMHTDLSLRRPLRRLLPVALTWLFAFMLLMTIVAATPARATAEPAMTSTGIKTVKASYKLSRNGLVIAEVQETFARLANNRYLITSETRPEGAAALLTRDVLTMTSEGRITKSGLVPTTFTFKRRDNTKRNFVAHFDWSSGELTREAHSNGELLRESFELATGTLDRLASMYQFMLNTPKEAAISTLMTQGKEAETYLYAKQGESTLNTAAGAFETLHYARQVKPGDSKADIWLAKSKHHVPVRIIFEDNRGVKLEQQLIALSIE
jgi:Protein of unknown function (DUF3108)